MKSELKMIFSKTFPEIGKSNTGRQFVINCLSSFLWPGIMLAFFHSLGNDSVSIQFLKIKCNGFDIEEASFIMRIEISS